jgi:hypothetical protein
VNDHITVLPLSAIGRLPHLIQQLVR